MCADFPYDAIKDICLTGTGDHCTEMHKAQPKRFFFVSCDFKREISDFDICWVFNEFFKDSFDSYDLTWPVFLSIEQTNTHRCDKRNREMCKYVMENAIVSRHLNQRLHSPFAKMKSTRTALATRHHSRACDRNGNNIFWCFAVGCGCGKQHNKQMTPD